MRGEIEGNPAVLPANGRWLTSPRLLFSEARNNHPKTPELRGRTQAPLMGNYSPHVSNEVVAILTNA
jgi:hypothetical protein